MIRHIDGMVELSQPLHVHPEVLGLQVAVKIGEDKGMISLPSAPGTGDSSPGQMIFLQSASLGHRALPNTTLVAKRDGMWGYISAGQAFVYVVRIRIPIGDADGSVPEQMKELGRKFDVWYGIVRDWVSAWSGQVRYREFTYEESHIHATVKVEGKGGLYGSGQSAGRIFIGETMATRNQVEAAFYCASRGYNIPLQYALLQRAISDYHTGDSRQSVINACAAAEVSLSTAVRAALSFAKVPEETAGRIITRTSGVVEMFRLFIVAGGKTDVSDNRVIDQLARPRNAAAHDGIPPSNNDLQRAIKTATEIVEAAAPLPEPATAKRYARKLDG
jgi:hypothetical protein